MNKLSPLSWWRNVPQEKHASNDPFFSLHQSIDRLFEDFEKQFRFPTTRFGDFGASPRIDVSETDEEIRVEADLPGLDEDDVEVVLSDYALTIKGEKKSEHEEKRKDYHVVERSSGSFSRTIALPFSADPDQINATFDKGVLTVRLPKPAEVMEKTHKIKISNKK